LKSKSEESQQKLNNQPNGGKSTPPQYEKYYQELNDRTSGPNNKPYIDTICIAPQRKIVKKSTDQQNQQSSGLIKLEEKEYLDQMVTTTTTVTTLTSDSLFFANPYGLHNQSMLDFAHSNYLGNNGEQTGVVSTVCHTDRSLQNPRLAPNLNKNIYSCLTNIYSDF
jgi:hypothetical protein